MIFGKIDYLPRVLSSCYDCNVGAKVPFIINDSSFTPGRYELDDDNFYLKLKYETKSDSEGVWEGHRKFLDVHFLLAGNETIFFNHVDNMTPTDDYITDGDYQLFSGAKLGSLILKPGYFVIFDNSDIHKTGLTAENERCTAEKIVLKIKVD